MRRIYQKIYFFCFFFSTFSAHAFLGSQIGIPTPQDFQQFESKNFVLIYPKNNLSEALKSAFYLEEAHQQLSKAFQYRPNAKTHVILTDHLDSANGVTSTTGSQGIVLYLTAPDPYLSIGEYDQWLKNLVLHEYAHYLTLDQRRGFFAFLKYIFGDLFYPNNAWPTWLAEGFAVYVESKYTMGGRGDSTFYNTLTRDALFRKKVLNDPHAFRKLHELSGPVPDFPFGEEQYYVGYAVIEQMTRSLGKNAPSLFAEESSWRIPYLLNGTLENVENKTTKKNKFSFRSLWNNWIDEEMGRHEESLEWISKNLKTPIVDFNLQEAGNLQGTRLSADGKKLAYVFSSGHDLSQIVVWDNFFNEQQRKIIFKELAYSGPGLSFSKDGKKLVYSKREYSNRYFFNSDLYLRNFEENKTYRLTYRERAKDPDLCGDHGIVYSVQSGSLAELRYFDLKTNRIRVLYRGVSNAHFSNPRCDEKGEVVYFSEHHDKMWEVAKSFSFQTRKVENLFGGAADGFGALFLEPRKEGIFFTKVLNGYYLLARFNPLTRKTENLLASTGGIWMPSLTFLNEEKRVIFSHLTSQGFKVSWADLDLKQMLSDPPRLPSKERFTNETESAQTSGSAKQVIQKPELVQIEKPHSYSLFSNQIPRIWSPYLVFSEDHSQYGGTVIGWDDLDILRYQLMLYYDSISKVPEGILDLNIRIGTFDFAPFIRKEVSDYILFASSKRLYLEEFGSGGVLSRPVPFDFWTFTPALSFERMTSKADGDFGSSSYDPEYRFGGALLFDATRRVPYSLTDDRGAFVKIVAKHFNNLKIVSPKRTTKALVKWDQYFSFFPRHASLLFSASGVYAHHALSNFPSSRLKVGGSGSEQDLDPPLRGYPRGNFDVKSALLGTAEYRIPIAQIFDGVWELPVFFRNVGVYGFYDVAKMSRPGFSDYADSVGGGILANTVFGYYFPFQFQVEFAHGLKQNLGGENTISLSLQSK